MNFERLIQTFNNNYSKISNKRLALRNIIDEYSILKKKKQKLKLGKIIFEIKNMYFNEVLIYQELEMIYCRQDNTQTDALKPETILKRYAWQWDFNNIAAAIIVGYFAYSFAKLYVTHCFGWLVISTNLSEEPRCQALLKYVFSSMVLDAKFVDFAPFRVANSFMYELLSEMVVFFKLL